MYRKIKYVLYMISFGILFSFFIFSKSVPTYAIASGSLTDGVYALRNVATNKYLDIQYDSVEAGARMQVYSYSSIPDTDSERSGLFKFIHVYNNMYRVYTMRNNGNSFSRVTDTEVSTTSTIGTYWTIGTTADGYYTLKANGTTKYLSSPASGVNSNKYCTTEALSTAGNRAKWVMVRYTGSVIRGVSFHNFEPEIYVGQTRIIQVSHWTTDLNVNSVTYEVKNSTSWSLPVSASIDSTGLLTANESEQIDIVIHSGWGMNYYQSMEVKQALEDGVYAFKNTYSNMYMDVRSDSIYSLAEIQQYNYLSTPNSEDKRAGLFKVSYDFDTSKYEIRLMTNNYLFLGTTEESGTFYLVSTAISNSWKIIRDNDNHIIINDNDRMICVQDNESSGRADENSSRLILSNDIIKNCWIPYRCNTMFSSGNLYYNHSRIVYNENEIPVYDEDSNSMFSNNMYYSTDMETDISSIDENINLYDPSGEVSHIAYYDTRDHKIKRYNGKVGMVSIRAEYTNGESYDANVYFGPYDTFTGECFLMQNIEEDIGYVTAQIATCSKELFTYGDNQIWRRIPVDNEEGYYNILSMNGLYLTAPNTNDVGANIELTSTLYSYGHDARQLWGFEEIGSGNRYRIKSKNQSNIYLNIESTNGELIQDTYLNNNSYYDEFNVVLLGKEMETQVFYQRSFGPNNNFNIIDPSIAISELYKEYSKFSLLHLENYFGPLESDKDRLLSMMTNNMTKIMVISGHGSATTIDINDGVVSAELSTYDLGSLNLSNIDIIIFEGCSTANPNVTNNLIEVAANAGAKVAIGWSVDQFNGIPHEWIGYFFKLMNTINLDTNRFYTVEDAIDTANRDFSGAVSNAVMSGLESFSYNR